MVPKKPSSFIPKVAKDLNMDEDVVDLIVTTYWQEVRKLMVEMKCNNINVINFGAFATKPWKLEELEKKYTDYMDIKSDATTFRKYGAFKDLKNRVEAIRRLLNDYNKEKEKKEQVKLKRNVQKTNDNLEESQGDIPGNKE